MTVKRQAGLHHGTQARPGAKVRRGLDWIGCIALSPALLLGSLASFANSPPTRDGSRLATDSSEIRADPPQWLLRARAKPVPGVPVRAGRNYRGVCEHSLSGFCYDQADKRIVYTQARLYMPHFDGLTAEGVSLRRHAIRFKYSFR